MTENSIYKKRKEAIEALPPLRDVIAAYDLKAQKSLGQNFLLDMNITDKIVREACLRDGESWDGVNAFEIGPGPGGLTRSLLKSEVQTVTAVEFDKRAVAALDEVKDAAGGSLNLINGDALKVDVKELSSAPRVIVANLPYNIATPLLIGWLKDIREDNAAFLSMSLMFQKEVADRIVAAPNTKHYGRLSIITQWLCRTDRLYDLPPNAFTPPPKVNSSVVYFSPKKLEDSAPSFKEVEKVTASAFNQRRKMIRSSLKDYIVAIESLGIDSQKRAENLTVAEFLSIANFDK